MPVPMATLDLHADDLIVFAHIVQAGSFTRAAERTGLPKATLSRRLSQLEQALGERLMQRSTRRLALTEFGERMLEHAQRLADEAQEAAALAQHRRARPHGTLRVSLPPEFNELSLVDVISAFRSRHPDLRLELDLSPRRVDLVAERFDAAVRVASQLPDDRTLVARRIATLHGGLYASPAYLQQHGRPQQPAELEAHQGLALVTGSDAPRWRLSQGHAHWEGMSAQGLAANSVGLLQALALRGLGIVGLSLRFAEPLAGQGLLERVLPQWRLPPTVVWCVTPGRRLLPRRTEAFVETLTSILADER